MKRKITFEQLKRIVKEARINPAEVIDGNAEVKHLITEMREVGEDAEKIEKLEGLLKQFTRRAMKKAMSAKALRARARTAVKNDCKPLDNAAKQLADMMEVDGKVFFSVKMGGTRVGVMLTRSAEELSYGKIAAKLTDPDFLKTHRKVRKLGKELMALLDKGRDLLDEDDLKASWSADLYSQDPDTGDVEHLEESFLDTVKDAFHAAVDWFANVFNRLFPSKQEQYVIAAQEWVDKVNEILDGAE